MASTSTAGPATPAFATSSRPRRITAVLPTKAPKSPIPVIGPTNWTGFYAGGFFGAAGGRTDIAFPGSPQATNRPWVFGPVGGIQLGYNYQFTNNWVLGFEGDIGAADVHGGRSAGIEFTRSRHDVGVFGLQDKTSWMATATARVGYAMGRTLMCTARPAPRSKTAASPRPASIRRVRAMPLPNLCVNQAGVVFANGEDSPRRGPASAGPSAMAPNSTLAGIGRPRPSTTIFRSAGTRRWLPTAPRSCSDRSDISQVKVGLNYRFLP